MLRRALFCIFFIVFQSPSLIAQSQPEVLTQTKDRWSRIALDANYLYFTDAGKIKRTNKDGTDLQTIAVTKCTKFDALLLNADAFFGFCGNDRKTRGEVVRIPLDGSAVSTIAQCQKCILQEAVADDDAIYWTQASESAGLAVIRKYSFVDQQVKTIAQLSHINAHGLALDDSYVYWTSFSLTNGVYVGGAVGKVDKAGTRNEILIKNQNGARAILLKDGQLYWHRATGNVYTMNLNSGSGSIRQILSIGPFAGFSAVDNLFFVGDPTDQILHKIEMTSLSANSFYSGPLMSEFGDIKSDSNYVYWTSKYQVIRLGISK